jgi:hypothetical protein
MPRLSKKEIKEVLRTIQPEGFDWTNFTPSEGKRYAAICYAQFSADQKPELKELPLLSDEEIGRLAISVSCGNGRRRPKYIDMVKAGVIAQRDLIKQEMEK